VTDVYIETGNKRVFACAYDWPGWCRSGKDEAAAVETLGAYAGRYAPVAKRAGQSFDAKAAVRVVEHVHGGANTDFGVPHQVAERDTMAVSADDGKRLAALVKASWAIFDQVVAKAPATLRKGPRGGGRDRDEIVDHVLGAEVAAYARKLGIRVAVPDRTDTAAVKAFRETLLREIARPSNGKPPVEKGWPQRYAARRIAWHVLDHAWEIEDKSERSLP
jgi:hypothetical protein